MPAMRLIPLRRVLWLLVVLCIVPSVGAAESMRDFIDRHSADLGSIERRYDVRGSSERHERLRTFYQGQQEALRQLDFDALDQANRIDYVLLRTRIEHELKELAHERKEHEEVASFIPFAQVIIDLENARRQTKDIDGADLSKTLTDLRTKIADARKAAEQSPRGGADAVPVHVLTRAIRSVENLRGTLRRWYSHYSGYDPEFTWWARQPWTDADQAFEEYLTLLRRRAGVGSDAAAVTGGGTGGGRGGSGRGGRGGGGGAITPAPTPAPTTPRSDENDPIIGNPIGRQALLDALAAEMIPYSPEELIDIANKEFEWCEREMKRATADLKLNSWPEALDFVSKKHVKPGDQPKLIKELADEAIKFLEDRDLVTIPQLARDTWRIEMMSVERQRVNPYFTGGEVISVSYPTDAMSHEDKLMSMRGNNPAFSRATVQHELIPGHHLQGFMADRYNTHRRIFRTPFLVEGWALYWEMLLWDKDFPRNAEDRVGMLFWRSHRCARIIFSLNFHLGKMTPQECIDLLVNRVGHERRNATAEVRRSVQGGYPPLYQAAYMLGGLQIRALHKDLVQSGKMTDKQFHDAILKENSIPVAMIRASLTKQTLSRDFKSDWEFYEGINANRARPTEASSSAKPATTETSPQANNNSQRGQVYRDRVEPRWFANNTRFWYRNNLPDGAREFILVDAATGKRQPAFDHAKVAESLAKLTGKEVDPKKLPIEALEFSEKSVTLKDRDTSWTLDLSTGALAKSEAPPARDDSAARTDLTPGPSRRTGAKSEITFHNTTDKDVNLFWSDTQGDRQPYGVVKPNERRVINSYAGHVWIVTAAEGGQILAVSQVTERPQTATIAPPNALRNIAERFIRRPNPAANTRSARSPDGMWEAFVRDRNLFLRDLKSNEEHALTRDIAKDETYGRDRSRQQAVNLAREAPSVPDSLPTVFWSPDSKRLIALRTRIVQVRTIHMVDSSPRDQTQPKLVSMPYAKPGDDLPIQKPDLFDVESKQKIAVKDDLFSNPWDLSRFRWESDSSRFTFLFNQRGHQVLRLLSIDAKTGAVQPIIEETSKTFIDYSTKLFIEQMPDTNEIIWASERDGWNHLYLYDAKTGQVKNPITKGEWLVRNVDLVDREKRQVWFRAGGIRKDQDPYFIHYARVNFDGSGLTILTEGNGSHTVAFSPDRQYIIDTYSRVDQAPITELRRADDGSLVCRLEEADASSLADAGPRLPEPFVAKGRDGQTDIYGVIWRPTHFDEKKKYPVIESIYAGPQGAFVPKTFRTNYAQQRLADKGFIVVQIDGMGTNFRSKKFHDVAWQNLADAGFPDRILWHKAAAAKYPQMDLTRVGLYGGSAGGQNALGGLLFHPEFYKVGAADCGCHDNRMDKIWWNEQWMGYPLGKHYEDSSNVTNAHKLQGKLLLTVGELDRNVDPASTMQVVNALIKANKDFDLIVFPGGGHGAGGSPYGQRRREEFFIRHLIESPAKSLPSISSTN